MLPTDDRRSDLLQILLRCYVTRSIGRTREEIVAHFHAFWAVSKEEIGMAVDKLLTDQQIEKVEEESWDEARYCAVDTVLPGWAEQVLEVVDRSIQIQSAPRAVMSWALIEDNELSLWPPRILASKDATGEGDQTTYHLNDAGELIGLFDEYPEIAFGTSCHVCVMEGTIDGEMVTLRFWREADDDEGIMEPSWYLENGVALPHVLEDIAETF